MSFKQQEPGLWVGSLVPEEGSLARIWREHGAKVIVGHPTFHNEGTIGAQLRSGISGAQRNFGGRPVSFVVTDGSWT